MLDHSVNLHHLPDQGTCLAALQPCGKQLTCQPEQEAQGKEREDDKSNEGTDGDVCEVRCREPEEDISDQSTREDDGN